MHATHMRRSDLFLLLVVSSLASSICATKVLSSNHTINTHVRRRQQTSCPTVDPNTFSLSQELAQQFKVAAELSILVTAQVSGCIDTQIPGGQEKYERFDGWWTESDQALVAKDNGTCYAVYMGTTPCNLFDQFQNIWPFSTCIPNTDCAVRSGYYNAYYNSYYHRMRAAVISCTQSCGDAQCPLILHGHSQGGSIATIASIDLRDFSPITMTFGAPRVILKSSTNDCNLPCSILDTSRHYRFVNTIDGRYDERVMNNVCSNYRQVGHALLLDDDNFPTIATVGLDNDLIRAPVDVPIHQQGTYTERIDRIAASNCFPIPLTKWPAGHWCSDGDECESGNCQDRRVCD